MVCLGFGFFAVEQILWIGSAVLGYFWNSALSIPDLHLYHPALDDALHISMRRGSNYLSRSWGSR
jgi:hypothetical protein